MLYEVITQGVDPNLDFSDINRLVDVYERVCRLPIHPRQQPVGQGKPLVEVLPLNPKHLRALQYLHLQKQNNSDGFYHAPK